jgi:hypothetical protein
VREKLVNGLVADLGDGGIDKLKPAQKLQYLQAFNAFFRSCESGLYDFARAERELMGRSSTQDPNRSGVVREEIESEEELQEAYESLQRQMGYHKSKELPSHDGEDAPDLG